MAPTLTMCALALAAHLGLSVAQPQLLLTPWADNSIRVQMAGPGNPIADPPYMALIDSGPPPRKTHASSETGSSTSLTNGNLYVTVDPTTGYITATRVSDNTIVLKQTGVVFDAPNVPVSRLNSYSALVTFAGTAGEKIYGLGEHRTGVVNQMPYSKRFADSQDYGISHGGDVSIPWYASSLGYGFVWNSPAYGYVDISETEIAWFANATQGVDFWITTTSDAFDPTTTSPYAELMNHYVDAVGHAPTMPYYSTGFIQCKDRYRNQTQLLDVARGYVERQLPISVIVIDWMHWVAQGDWQFNPVCWPDPQGMFDELQTMGIELMVTYWPFQTTGSIHWDEFSQNGYLAVSNDANKTLLPYDGDQYLVDEFNEQARQAAFQGFWDGYGKYGIKTVWIDAAEPEHFGGSMEGNWSLAGGYSGEIMEAWIQQHAKMLQDGFATKGIAPEDYFILPRHAWAGSWRYSAALWSGDIESTFDELAIQIRVVQGVMMSGPALWSSDIGGYFGGTPGDPVFNDLIVRWLQFGSFCPLFRLHGHRGGGPPSNECGGTNGDNEIWNLASDEDHYNSMVSVMHIREGLRNYVAEINAETAATGMPMLRPMFLQWPNDPLCQGFDVEDQFMFGPTWLVAPVYEYNASSRSVYLPLLDSNHTWIYYYNFSSVGQGGMRFNISTPITEFPLFFIQPVTPTPPVAYFNATTYYSAARNDTVLCGGSSCEDANAPGQQGNYVTQRSEGLILAAQADSIEINGTSYAVVPLTLYYSVTHNDNLVTINTTVPDASYTAAGGASIFENGYVLATQAPGTVPLQIWFKDYNGADWDYASVASPAGIAWVTQNGYTNTGQISGFIFSA